ARVGDDEVLAARLADDAREGAVAIEPLADAAPERAEGRRAAGEVDAREVLAVERRGALLGAAAREHAPHAVRQARFAQELHDGPRAPELRGRRLPERDVAREDRRGRQVRADGEEVERRDREDEALERAIVRAVPLAAGRDRLLGVDLLEVVG